MVYGRNKVQFHAFLTSELDKSGWLDSGPGPFTPGIYETESCVSARPDVKAMENKKIGLLPKQ